MTQEPKFKSVVLNTNPEKPLSKKLLANRYSPHFLRTLEFIYGTEGIISSGGLESVDELFANIELNGKTMLDVGCGFGGVAIHLAHKHSAQIIGVDIEPYMITCAAKLLEKSKNSLKGEISFQTLVSPLGLEEFSKNTFDVILCKQMLYHLPLQKRATFLKEIYRVLKPGGKVVIEDLMTESPSSIAQFKGPRNKNSLNGYLGIEDEEFSYLIEPLEYQTLIDQVGFIKINHIDTTEKQIRYTQNDANRIKNSKEKLSHELDESTYLFMANQWDKFVENMKARTIVSAIFIATK